MSLFASSCVCFFFLRPCLNFHVCLLLLFFDVMPIHVVVSVFSTRRKGFMISINYHTGLPYCKLPGGMAVKQIFSYLPCAFDLEFRFIGSFLAVYVLSNDYGVMFLFSHVFHYCFGLHLTVC